MSGIALYATVFLAALGESTALVGLLVPGVGVVLAASVVAARGGGSLTGVAAAASAGAVVGFGLSYYIGLAGGRRLSLWSQRAHGALEKAKAFLDRFGGWGVFWGHFFGPVRACVPLVAGAGKLSPRRFWIASVSGGVAWGFALTAMGAALSRGWRLAEAVLGRGSLLLAGFAAILYVVLRLSAGALALGLRLLPSTSSAILNFLLQHGDARQLRRLAPAHPRLLAWVQRRLAPDHATGLLLSTGAVACACFAWLFFGIVEDLLFHDPLVSVDLNLFHLLQTLRTPGADSFFLLITYLGSGAVLAAAAAAGGAALVGLGRRFEAGLLLLGFGCGEILMWGLKHAVARPRPTPALSLALDASAAFPSNHAFSSIALFGFLAYLGAGGLQSSAAKARVFAWTGVLVVSVGMSRLYLGAHWPSDVAAGYALGGIWLSALVTAAEAHRRFGKHPSPMSDVRAFVCGLAVLGTVGISWGIVAWQRLPVDVAKQPAAATQRNARDSELPSEVDKLASYPVETLTGDPMGPISLFVVSRPAQLREAAQSSSWSVTADLRWAAVLERWALAMKGAVETALPAYPIFWRGRPQKFSFALPAPSGGRWVARCWDTGLAFGGERELWAVWLRRELPPERFLGVPTPVRQPREAVPPGLFSDALIASGRFARLPLQKAAPFELLVPVTNAVR